MGNIPRFVWIILALAVVGAGSTCCGVGAAWLFTRGPLSGPSARSEGQTWTHKELLEHLERKGIEFETFPGDGPPPTVGLVLGRRGVGGAILNVRLCKTEQDAREAAGPARDQAFVWGRFLFSSHDASNLIRIKEALNAD